MTLHGVYTQPGAKGLAGLSAWETWTGVRVAQMLDFTGTTTWKHITSWLPWEAWTKLPAMGKRLELSVAMLPDDPGTSLAMCAAGAYNEEWETLARNLVGCGLHATVIRPGWEFNGTHYRWTTRSTDPALTAEARAQRAAHLRAEYAESFRQIVTTMRDVTGQAFRFVWCPMTVIDGRTDYTSAYPGDEYVDVIGVDVYDVDVSTLRYPYRSTVKTDPPTPPTPVEITTAQDAVWAAHYAGPGGLRRWADMARAHGKGFAVDEWGVTFQPPGWGSHGGLDNPRYVDRLLNAARDHGAEWVNYFEIDNTQTGVRHALSRPDTLFPRSAERYLARVGELASR